MKNGDIVSAFVAFAEGKNGKKRPILVLEDRKGTVLAYKITTKYENKSDSMKSHYYPLLKWRESNLDQQSYVDTFRPIKIVKNSVNGQFKTIGKLSLIDKEGLRDFILNKNLN